MSETLSYTWHLQNHLSEYWSFYKDAFSEPEIEKIISEGESLPKIDAKIGNSILNTEIRETTVSWIPSSKEENQWLFRRLTDLTIDGNAKYFGFDLNTIETLQYSVYNVNGHYKQHIDTKYSQGLGARKLSFVLMLSDPNDYEGGDLRLHYGSEPTVLPRDKGTLLFFPSYTLHDVTPVTKGVRKTLVGWVLGPSFL